MKPSKFVVYLQGQKPIILSSNTLDANNLIIELKDLFVNPKAQSLFVNTGTDCLIIPQKNQVQMIHIQSENINYTFDKTDKKNNSIGIDADLDDFDLGEFEVDETHSKDDAALCDENHSVETNTRSDIDDEFAEMKKLADD